MLFEILRKPTDRARPLTMLQPRLARFVVALLLLVAVETARLVLKEKVSYATIEEI